MTANQQNPTFEDLRYDPFLSNNSVLLDNLTDPDFLPDEARNFIHTFEKNSFSALHINIRSLSKNFENVKHLLSTLNCEFKIICLAETWNQEEKIITFLEFQITQ